MTIYRLAALIESLRHRATHRVVALIASQRWHDCGVQLIVDRISTAACLTVPCLSPYCRVDCVATAV